MALWIQRVFLGLWLLTSLSPASAEDRQIDAFDVNTELFEIGASIGVMNIQDFGSEFTLGVNANFIATEDFFLQINAFFAHSQESDFEEFNGAFAANDDRNFNHFNFLVGFNLFQGEIFIQESKAQLSALYFVAGVGDTTFIKEAAFTYVLGAGFQMALSRQWILRVDARDYMYKSSVLREDNLNDVMSHNIQLSAGVSYLF